MNESNPNRKHTRSPHQQQQEQQEREQRERRTDERHGKQSERRRRSQSPDHHRCTSKTQGTSQGQKKSHIIKSFSTDLNKLKAQIMKARLKRSPDLAELERQLAEATGAGGDDTEIQKQKQQQKKNMAINNSASHAGSDKNSTVVMLPTIDSRGRRMASGGKDSGSTRGKTKEEDGDEPSIMQMARYERETAGDVGKADMDLAKQIARDTGFANDLDYIDDNIARLSRQRGEKTSEQKRNEAIRDYRATESAISICDLCFKQTNETTAATAEGVVLRAPDYPVVALGNRVYLGLPNREPMCDGHCILAPIEHVSGSSLKCDDDTWVEITNFMKSLMQMFAALGQTVVFLETVMSTSPAKARHCVIECIPMPADKAVDAPAYFRESILAESDEWSQNRKIIDTSVKKASSAAAAVDSSSGAMIQRGGFRNTMTAQVPYFHVWFDYRGGLGHVIETPDTFPPWFGREVVAGIMDLPPTVYRKPRKLKESRDQRLDRADEWKKQFGWHRFDWTKLIDQE
ncbi:Pre-mRNA-splicing factor cwf19 [Coemansia sp. RSA 1285]|nr:Pre-mRNA-splicing factor cwf19 [Coemansia sp. RSA 1804]KAJ2684140.1 Pre-mRNA-splicing factor cwf19 [Coemansia sp. RSA 1285]